MASSETDLFTGIVPFVAAAEAKSLRAAAERLGLTPSAVSKAITRLEADLGVRLLHRTSRSVALTEEGEAFLRSCSDAVTSVRAAREGAVSSLRAPRGRLSISVPLMLGRLVIVPALKRLLDRHPALTIDASLTDRFERLGDGSFDAAVRIGAVGDPHLVARKLATIRWVTVGAPAYLARRGTPSSPDELSGHNCLSFKQPNGSVRAWEFRRGAGAKATETAPTQGNLTTDHGEALVEAAIAGLGLFQAHHYIVADAVAQGRLVEVLAPFATEGPPVSLVLSPQRKNTPKVRAFAEFMVELLGRPSK
ncbi:MAG: LysR family transcriptional regulator [Polyangiaceae bacterium]|nr:LysR family transcriptional regulator [Polyangiaceae bacterium]